MIARFAELCSFCSFLLTCHDNLVIRKHWQVLLDRLKSSTKTATKFERPSNVIRNPASKNLDIDFDNFLWTISCQLEFDLQPLKVLSMARFSFLVCSFSEAKPFSEKTVAFVQTKSLQANILGRGTIAAQVSSTPGGNLFEEECLPFSVKLVTEIVGELAAETLNRTFGKFERRTN